MASRARAHIPVGLAAKVERVARDPIGRDMLRRGLRVESAAKRRLTTAPRRVNTGRLRASVNTRPIAYRGTFGARVGSNVNYALWVHDGTGIYGPRHTRIRPRRGRVLRFTPRGAVAPIYRPSVRGMRPNPFLRDALPAARG